MRKLGVLSAVPLTRDFLPALPRFSPRRWAEEIPFSTRGSYGLQSEKSYVGHYRDPPRCGSNEHLRFRRKRIRTAQGTVTFWNSENVADTTNPECHLAAGELRRIQGEVSRNHRRKNSVSNGDEYLNKITTAMAAGNAPDIFQTWLSGTVGTVCHRGKGYRARRYHQR